MKNGILLIFFMLANFVNANNLVKQDLKVMAIRTQEKVEIDGLLNEKVWQENKGISHFKQRNPNEGLPATQKTIVYVAFDNENLYVAARMYDSAPDSIISRLGRRDDGIESDLFGFFVDPYNDKRSGYYFGLNAAGTYYDGVLYNDDWDDDSWDGVWEGKSKIDEKGWCAEMRIPFSQLRFKEQEEYIWGINFLREIKRNQEEAYLVYKPKNESGFVSRFISLQGLEQIKPSNNIQILPYIEQI